MDLKETLAALERLKVETGSLVCLGCGHEHNCSTHGCAIIRKATELIKIMSDTFPEPTLLELAAQYLNTTPDHLREWTQAEQDGRRGMRRAIYYRGLPGVKWGMYNTVKHCFQFGICEDTPMLAEARLFQKIGDDARKWRFEPRQLPQK